MKKTNNIILYKDVAYVNNQNKNITKDKIVELFDNAYDDGCKDFRKVEEETYTNYIFNHNDEKTIVTIPASLISLNQELISKLDDIFVKLEKLKEIEDSREQRIKKQEKITKIKKYAAIAVLATAGTFALIKTAHAIVKWDNENFRNEVEESGATLIQNNLEMIKNHKEAMEHYYEDKDIEQKEQQQQIDEFVEQKDEFEKQQMDQMIEDMNEYRNLDTMPNVTKSNEQKSR